MAEDGGFFDDPNRDVAYQVDGRFWVNNHAHILKALGDIPDRFLCSYLNSIYWMPYVSGTTRLKLTQAGLRQIEIPLPPLPEQKRIVAKLDSLTARSKRAREELESVPRLVARYKQAVLAVAFRGELVPQDPNDEPASVLLERIRAERAATPKPKRGRRKAKAS